MFDTTQESIDSQSAQQSMGKDQPFNFNPVRTQNNDNPLAVTLMNSFGTMESKSSLFNSVLSPPHTSNSSSLNST